MSRTRNFITPADLEELKKAYKFVPNTDDHDTKNSTWQDRMAMKYSDQLHKTHVITDLTNYKESRIGLRWR